MYALIRRNRQKNLFRRITMLKVEHLKKTYPKSDRVAVDDISFELRPCEIFGFLGQNVAGKSTTI